MGYWPLRGAIAAVAVLATFVVAGTAGLFAYDSVDAEAQENRKRDEASQELFVFSTEISIEAAIIATKSDDNIKRLRTSYVENANVAWKNAEAYWQDGRYQLMRSEIERGRYELDGADGQFSPTIPAEDSPKDQVAPAAFHWDVAAGASLAALLLWSVWGGMSRDERSAVPVPVFPGEVEIQAVQVPAPAATSLPGPDMRPPERGRQRVTATARPKPVEEPEEEGEPTPS